MAGRASAFAVLGLAPGADAAAIEQAYKRLIKQHHPDRKGGDGSRAAEINRAYRELRGGKAPSDPLQFNEDFGAARKRPRWPVAALSQARRSAGSCRDWAERSSDAPLSGRRGAAADPPCRRASGCRTRSAGRSMTQAIDDAVGEAMHLFRTKDEMALAAPAATASAASATIQAPSLLDRCAAFDDAVVGLQDRDPLRDAGPFAPLAVTGRQWSAASALSDDYLAIDSRLDQIRLRVEIALAPQVPPIAPPRSTNSD